MDPQVKLAGWRDRHADFPFTWPLLKKELASPVHHALAAIFIIIRQLSPWVVGREEYMVHTKLSSHGMREAPGRIGFALCAGNLVYWAHIDNEKKGLINSYLLFNTSHIICALFET